MALVDFRLDTSGIAEVLKSAPFRDLMTATAVEVASRARSSLPAAAPVQVRPYTTDRQAASVVVLSRRTAGRQERVRALQHAAHVTGLLVHEPSGSQ
ncbi:hypothetical protein ADL21_11105 [Streptomyces albus subsp. albus]|nr:hypothetical protein ADL21_11105 [Streptomyces albus subsp. albus]